MAVTYVHGVPCINGGGQVRKLAALKPTDEDKAHFKTRLFSSVMAPDPSSWRECDLSIYKSPMRNQEHHGSCTGHAGVTAIDIVRRAMGQAPVLLSCTFPYSLVNGGRDQGASVSSILRVLEKYGTCTHAECGTDQIFKNQYPQTVYETAKKYMAQEAFLCRNFEEVCEAVNKGFPVPFGIQIGQNFNQLNSDGVCPPPDTVVGGHALCGVGLKKSRTGTWLLKFQNSWTEQWGLMGFAYLSKGSFDNMVDAYAIMYVTNINGPPTVIKEPRKLVISISDPIAAITTPLEIELPKVEEQPSVTVVPKEESLTAQIEATAPEAVLSAPPRDRGFRRRK